MSNTISKDTFDFMVNTLKLPYEGKVEGLGTVYARPVITANTKPRMGNISEGIFLSTGQILAVDTSSAKKSSGQNSPAIIPANKKKELEKRIEDAIIRPKGNGSYEVNLGMDDVAIMEQGDNLTVNIDEYSGTVNIAVIKKKNLVGGTAYETQSRTYKLNELDHYYPQLKKQTVTSNSDGGYSVSTGSADWLGDVLQYNSEAIYAAGIAINRIVDMWLKYGRFDKVTNPKGGFGWEYPSSRLWKMLGNTGSKALKGIGRLAGPIGRAGVGATILYDAMGLYRWSRDPSAKHAVHPGKAGLDAYFLGMGFIPGAGTVLSIAYFGSDIAVNHFYSNGWRGVLDDTVDNIIVPILLLSPHIDRKIPVRFIDSPIDTSLPNQLLEYNGNIG